MKTLILMSNSEWALLVHLEKGQYQVVDELEHPESKEKVGNLVSDRPGRTFSRVSAARHSLNEGQDVLATEREKFARELVKLCQERAQFHPFDTLWIVAGPKFLGELRSFFQEISHPSYSILEIHKEVSPCEPIEVKMGKILSWVHGEAPKKRSLEKSVFEHL